MVGTKFGFVMGRYSSYPFLLVTQVQQRIIIIKRASIKRLKEKTLGCFEFFLLYTLDYVPGLLAGC
jgi:hypothetical protein